MDPTQTVAQPPPPPNTPPQQGAQISPGAVELASQVVEEVSDDPAIARALQETFGSPEQAVQGLAMTLSEAAPQLAKEVGADPMDPIGAWKPEQQMQAAAMVVGTLVGEGGQPNGTL